MHLSIARAEQEWRIERVSDDDYAGPGDCSVQLPSDQGVTAPGTKVTRFSFARTSPELFLTPRLADRSVVVSPESPFFVPAGQEITLFCSTPLWVVVAVGGDETVLEEFPLLRPPDTWFGKSTREGELCYATRTTARIRRQDLPVRLHRAVTELLIRNDANDTLQVERVNLSVPYLSLYATAEGQLWSDKVTLHRTVDGRPDELEIADRPPDGVDPSRVSGARVTENDNAMVRAFGALFR